MSDNARAPRQLPVLVVMGVSGSGKSTVAGILAGQLGWDLVEGDDLHPAANVAKMSAGIPLADEDRWPWLDRVAAWIRNHTATGVPGIITCSALKRSYRDKLSGDNVVFVHLAGSKDIIGQRLTARTDHYMPATLLDSQIATLEPPETGENALSIVAGRAPAEGAAEIIRSLRLTRAAGTTSRQYSPAQPDAGALRGPSRPVPQRPHHRRGHRCRAAERRRCVMRRAPVRRRRRGRGVPGHHDRSSRTRGAADPAAGSATHDGAHRSGGRFRRQQLSARLQRGRRRHRVRAGRRVRSRRQGTPRPQLYPGYARGQSVKR